MGEEYEEYECIDLFAEREAARAKHRKSRTSRRREKSRCFARCSCGKGRSLRLKRFAKHWFHKDNRKILDLTSREYKMTAHSIAIVFS